jgi:hypothetical protein
LQHGWFALTADSFQIWYDKTRADELAPDIPQVPPSPPEVTITTPPKTFRSNIKITVADYPKLKEDKHWRTYNHLLQATAANHDTPQVLDIKYVPTDEDKTTFEQKQYFMYNVFTQTINTSKGCLCVRSHELTQDAQMVYCELLTAYNDDLSTTLTATTLRNELTLLKMDEKWRSGYEHFLNLWTTKIHDLESVEDSTIDNQTKRIWLTATLQSNSDMRSAIRQAQTTQLTLHGMDSTSTTPSWSSFYNMLLSTAKMLDKERSDISKTQRCTHQMNTTRPPCPAQWGGRNTNTHPGHGHQGRGPNTSNKVNTQCQFTKYTGPNMPMKVDYIFSRADWPKLSTNQRNTLIALKKSAKEATQITSNVNTTPPRLVNAQVNVPSSDNSSVTTDISGPSIHQVLSQTHVTTPSINTSSGTTLTLPNTKWHYLFSCQLL